MTWVTPKTWSFEEVPTKTQLDDIFANLEHLKALPEYYLGVGDGTSDWTETSTSFVDVDSTFDTGSMTWKTGHVLVIFMGNITHASAINDVGAEWTVSVNGTDIGTVGIGRQTNSITGGDLVRIIPITAGTYSIKFRWRSSNGNTITLDGNGYHPFFMVRQIDFTP